MSFFLLLFLMVSCFAFADDYNVQDDEGFKYGTHNALNGRDSHWRADYKKSVLPEKYKKYFPKIMNDDVEILNYDEYNPEHQKATQRELDRLRKYYRHVQLKNKVPQLSYIALKYIYAMPTSVNGYIDKLSGSTIVQNTAIDTFKQMSSGANSLLLDERSLGFGVSYGRRLSLRTHSEWDVMFYQKSFVYIEPSSAGIVIQYNYTNADGKEQKVVSSYRNLEYIQRNFAVIYSRQYDFINFFDGKVSDGLVKFAPYVTVGVGGISRWNFLRLSSGELGSSNGQDLQTNEQMFNFMPVVALGGGIKWKVSDAVYLDGQLKSIQPMNDINFSNYIVSGGLRVYF